DRDAVTTTVVAAADLSVTKTGAAVDTAGTAISWTVQASNAGPSDAAGVVVSDTLPAGFTFVSASGGGTYSATTNAVTWTVGGLADGASTPVYAVNATIPATASGAVTNRARVAATTPDPTAGNDRDAVTTTVVAAADLSVTKTGAAVDTAGTAIAWTVQATNAGPSDATGVVVSGTLPAGFAFVSATGGGTYSAPTNAVTWTVGGLADGVSTPVYTVNATIPATASGPATNRARVAATTADPTTANDRDAVTTTIATAADLSVAKTGAAVDTAGTAISWTVQATNAGPSDAAGVVVSDTLPAGFTFVSATGGGTYSAPTNAVTWTVGTLADGASTPVYTVNATIPATASGPATNRARVAATTADPAAANDRDAVTTTIAAVADLVAGASGPATAVPSTQITFTASVTNVGPSTATAIVVTDTLPAGVTFVSATGGGVYSVTDNVVTWPAIASIAPGAPATTFDVVVDVDAGTSGAITNIVGVVGAEADPVPGDNRATSVTTVSAPSPQPAPAPGPASLRVPVLETPRLEAPRLRSP
ncbi:MAG: DUF11 domain-containing protein, partial [Gemmatimonadetes bacterium]|nr:DUF11 domain-containing protein [Gemmatimonadota bacterium]